MATRSFINCLLSRESVNQLILASKSLAGNKSSYEIAMIKLIVLILSG